MLYRCIFILSFLCVFNFSFVKAGDYISTTLIETSWGKEDNMFGISFEAEGNCPQSLDVDEKGNLAIVDLANKRIQFYSFNGNWKGNFSINSNPFDIKFLNGNIALLAPYDFLIETFSRKGILINDIAISRKIDLIDGLRANQDQISIQTIEQKQYMVNSKTTQLMQLQSQQQGLQSHIPEVRFQTRWVDSHTGKLIIIDEQTNSERIILLTTKARLGSVVFLDTDEDGYIYVRKELFDKKNKSFFEVDKIDFSGTLNNSIKIKNENIISPYRPITVDKKGNIYVLQIHEEKFSVIKWFEHK